MTDKIGYTRKGDVAVLRIKNPPVNALSHAVREGLVAGMAQAEADDGVKAVVIVGEGRAFIAGADITEFGKTPLEPFLPDVCKRIEDSPLIVVASMHGVSLGGGLEIALSAHYRVAQPSAKVGLPEVHLGLIPGAGATQRLPRLIGVDPSLDLITSGRQVKAAEAESLGIVDQVTEGDPEDVGVAYAENLIATNAPRRPVSEMAAPAPIDWDAAYDGTLKKGRGQISPAQAVRAVQAAAELPFDEGMLAERKIFMELMETDQRQGMIHAFFSERAVGNLPELKGVEPRALQSIGIIGGGTMGAGIATAALLAGFNVVLIEMKEDAAEAARGRIAGNLSGALKRGKITQMKYDAMTNTALEVSINYDSLASVDLVIEAVFEDMELKRKIFTELDRVMKPGAILATNTSALNIDEIAAMTKRPEDVIGLHFFSPANVMKLLEIVRAKHTADDVVATSMDLAAKINKIAVLVGVCPGFVGNRILFARQKQANKLLQQGLMPWDVDAALNAFGFKMGPFQMSDLAGLDIGWSKGAKTENPIRDALCEMDRRGQKTQAGFYDYDESRRPIPSDVVAGVIKDITGAEANQMSQEQIIEICIYPMINEAVKILEENKAQRPSDIDVVWLNGYGWPADKGGPMFYGDMVGAQAVLDVMEKLGAEDPEFAPAELLRDLAKNGGKFTEIDTGGLKV